MLFLHIFSVNSQSQLHKGIIPGILYIIMVFIEIKLLTPCHTDSQQQDGEVNLETTESRVGKLKKYFTISENLVMIGNIGNLMRL
jgi:hypothetical protein